MKPRRARGGIRRKRKGREAYVRLHSGKGGLWTRRYPLATPVSAIQEDIDAAVAEYRRRHPKGQPGTLAADAPRYLRLLVDRPRLQHERTTQLAWWIARFGHRARWSLTPVELETALNERLASGAAASTVRHYRTALYHLFTKLDGKNAPNPLRDVTPPRPPDPLPRAIPYAVIAAIFDAMPTEAHRRTLTSDQARTVRAQARRRGANKRAIARAFGISEAAVRKIAAGKADDARDDLAKTKARLQVLAYTGIPPAQLKQVQPADVDVEGASVLVRGRKKGGGVRPVRLPLTPRGLDAFRALAAADAWGSFNSGSAGKVFKRAVEALCRRLEAEAATRAVGQQLRVQLADAVAYDLRHSFLTEALRHTGSVRVTQALAMHRDARMTERYTLAAVDPLLQEAAAVLAGHPVGQAANRRPTSEGAEPGETARNPPIAGAAAAARKPAKSGAKDRKKA